MENMCMCIAIFKFNIFNLIFFDLILIFRISTFSKILVFFSTILKIILMTVNNEILKLKLLRFKGVKIENLLIL